MSADNVPGARCFGDIPGEEAKQNDGGWRFPDLGTSDHHIDLTPFRGQYVRITWVPNTPEDPAKNLLLYGFFRKNDDDKTLDVTTDSGAESPPTKSTAIPDVLERGSDSVTVPLDRTILVIQASDDAAGLCLVRPAEG